MPTTNELKVGEDELRKNDEGLMTNVERMSKPECRNAMDPANHRLAADVGPMSKEMPKDECPNECRSPNVERAWSSHADRFVIRPSTFFAIRPSAFVIARIPLQSRAREPTIEVRKQSNYASCGDAMASSCSGSVTCWIDLLKAGDPAAAQKMWEVYFDRLVALARRKLQGMARRAADEEDVALCALDSFCRGAKRGRYPQLADRDDLWRHLVIIADRKAIDLVQHERRQKRGGGKVRGESALDEAKGSSATAGLDGIADAAPTPELVAQMAEECQRLLGMLTEPKLRSIALWKLEGYTNEEIAAKLGCVERTVERKVRRIRAIWNQETDT
jgi:DNA-directed RNA polymerase specialized sigma24 family protein